MIGGEEELVVELPQQGEKITANLSEISDEQLRNLSD
jgi:uncharacterized protein YjeT (DUF2065 family)